MGRLINYPFLSSILMQLLMTTYSHLRTLGFSFLNNNLLIMSVWIQLFTRLFPMFCGIPAGFSSALVAVSFGNVHINCLTSIFSFSMYFCESLDVIFNDLSVSLYKYPLFSMAIFWIFFSVLTSFLFLSFMTFYLLVLYSLLFFIFFIVWLCFLSSYLISLNNYL